MSSHRVGIVGGAGWIGRLLSQALLSKGFTAPDLLTISGRSSGGPAWAHAAGVAYTCDPQSLVALSDIVVLCVRPEHFDQLSLHATSELVVSVMAGISLTTIAARTGASRVIRAMPNAAIEIGASYTPWCASSGTTEGDQVIGRKMFATCGVSQQLFSEEVIDYFTALTGSGPAIPALLAHALLEHAIRRGLPPEMAREALNTTLQAGVRLLCEPDFDPQKNVNTFLHYDGTTAAVLRAMMSRGFVESVHAGLAAGERAAAGICTDTSSQLT